MPTAAVRIVAHRGASFDAPENTLAAERLGWEQGADALETDVRLTRDGRLIVCHDENTKRVTGRALRVRDHALAELRVLDAGSWKGARFAGEKLPTLEEQLGLLPPGRGVFIELKAGRASVPELASVLDRSGVDRARITVISFDSDALRAVRGELPDVATSHLVSCDDEPATSARLRALVDEASAAGFSGLGLQQSWPLAASDAQRIKAAALQLHVWTVDDAELARRWMALGAVSVTTNRPGWLRQQLGL